MAGEASLRISLALARSSFCRSRRSMRSRCGVGSGWGADGGGPVAVIGRAVAVRERVVVNEREVDVD